MIEARIFRGLGPKGSIRLSTAKSDGFSLVAYEPETVDYFNLSGATGSLDTIDAYIRTIKDGGTVTLSSLTAEVSLLDAYAFVTQVSTDLRWLAFLKAKMTWSDGTNSAVGYASATLPGSETLGSELTTDGDFATSPGPWSTRAGYSISGGVLNCVAASNTFYQAITASSGALSKYAVTCTWGSGTAMYLTDISASFGSFSSSGSKTAYRTFVAANPSVGFDADAVTATFDNFSVKQVTAPSATGLWITKTKGGAAGWASTGSFNPNAAAFNVTITGA